MTRTIHVLLVEDNPADADLARDSLESGSFRPTLSVAVDGVDALAFLRRDGSYADAPRPDLILLDLNLPRMDGREVLAELKRDSLLRRIPVVILTSSAADRDVAQAYELGANCYVLKPMSLAPFQSMLESVQRFWFSLVTLPNAPR